ncbi:MAG: MFS transporter [Xanthomonadales bacterium]|nr:MFS transporter [Xanthomonadales bacterium]NIN58699.1 MFS transporter [Xanthomonadales bacterium]NIN73965.1 MFS transporter [Xanthomonadales bacterium]NIO12880.1 MFS transporter [Xanthomonadales bacterium]NIP11092.1 MFS transporter [Xanthomonadales bacterium]
MTETGKLRLTEKVGYGAGDMASNFFFQTFNIFLLYYYTDVFGISAAAVGTMFFVSRLWDAVNDPLMGAVADRTNTRLGKFRPYLLWMAVPYGVLGFAMFANPDLGASGKLVYAWVTYTLMMMCYTAINVPYSALMGVMTPSSKERTVLASFRFIGAFGGGLLISMLVRPLVQYLGAEDEALGFRLTMALFAVLSILMFWFTFATTRERVTAGPDDQASLKNDLRILITSRPWLVLCFGAIFTLAQVAIRSAVTIHYFKYYVGDDGAPFLWFFDRTTVFMTSGALALVAGVACTKLFSDRFEKKHALIGLSILGAIGSALFYFIPPDQFWTMLVVNVVGAFIAGPTAPLVWAMYADVADYGEWKHGRRTTGLVFSASMFAQKFGLTLGAGLSGWLLAAFGFEANVAQSETSLLGIRLMFTLLPATVAVLNVVVLSFYNLSDSKVLEIERELTTRKAAASAQPA